jgi:very-short-patch-repair endonuclease
VPRTLLDLAAAVRFEALCRILDRSEELELFDLGPVESLLDRTRGHHGWGRLRRAIALYEPVPFTRSGFERLFLAAVLRAGLSRPATNFAVAGFELDAYWPEQRFAVELDVYATHGTRGAFERDRLRQEDLKLAGIELTRVTDVRFHREPDAVLGRVAKLLAQRRGGA